MKDDDKSEQLMVATKDVVKQEILQQELITSAEQNDMMVQASEFVDTLMAADFKQIQDQQFSVGKLESIGVDEQNKATKQRELLKQPISELSRRAEDGGDVANALMDLKLKVESLDPAQIDFSPGWFTRLLGHLPWVGTPIKRYLTKFESAQTAIDSIIRSLEMGRDQLLRDNITLKDEQKELWASEKDLEKIIVYAQAVDTKLEERRTTLSSDPVKLKFVEEHLQFPVRQRIIDLQQQLLVQQQTMIASELIVRNNKELVRGVNRALNVTVTALQNATTIAMALAHQEKVLQKVESVNETTAKLIKDTANRLKTQGTAIHKGAASAQIDVNALKSALSDLKSALDDISTFRQKALPQMANVISDLDKLIDETKEPLKQIERE